MYTHTIVSLDNISQKGLSLFPGDKYQVIIPDLKKVFPFGNAVVLRSSDLHTTAVWLKSDKMLAVARAGAGTNNIPVAELSENGIVVFNTPGANANSVKELVIASMIMALRKLMPALDKAREIVAAGGEVLKTAEKAKKAFSGNEIAGKTLGVIGLGQIGVLVANAATALDMNVIGYDPNITVHSAWRIHDAVVRAKTIEELLEKADVVSIHVPFLNETKNLLGPKNLKRLKHGSVVLNFARNGIVDVKTMKEVLESGQCRSYITDFLNSAFVGMENVIQLPHLGASTEEAEERCAVMAVNELRDYLEDGNIKNSVNFPDVELGKSTDTRIVVLHKNKPGMLGDLAQVLGRKNINIIRMTNDSKGEFAASLLDVENKNVSFETEARLKEQEGVLRVRILLPE
ncbi:MAG: 3-phosphoglycerate dehydrogenase family protein [Candidatus Paceibacterota bacterium]|nr:3-phosphoglycerate dehydrogenase family protein [Candidatus Paceibacterota bacterium]